MVAIRIKEAAALLGVSDDTVRRWIGAGALTATSAEGATTVDGAELAALAADRARDPGGDDDRVLTSARNRFTGLVTDVEMDGVMAKVGLQCGPFTVTSLMSAEAARELGLEPGVIASAVVKATTVIVERDAHR
ncbi:excisionase family DNA-binding protein [Gordonia desulfuricans]|uniref:Excisionase family DNA-binding protein n=1 Tax=Gordonia desulfuricans TaxID=89051 RepID=A0A7K3LKY4_9ACTN|nr:MULTISPECIES: TOBE domain-containing protein [Gordonia]EMP10971.2 MerR family transcriptional regulator [Gordonia sp. NB41Y]NDK88878.1 excisionase family DNA-binding protein [Gordonia desulfuricans]WLP88893.1 TOBE domain-containing protein [Gordonia sp. NB41Y]